MYVFYRMHHKLCRKDWPHISALSERQSIRDLRGNQPQAMVPLALEMGKKARSLSLYTLGLIFITDL
jgi:hypothetical protein